MRVQSFSPIVNDQSNILILGSMPGVVSLAQHQYYAHPRNHFWRILYDLYELPLETDYDQRIAFASSKGIGLWDVLGECVREGSLDSNIQEPVPNDFESLFASYHRITHLLFNGTKAYDVFMRQVVPHLDLKDMTLHKLPSTSPANTMSYARKLEAWRNEIVWI
ncbi:DNA-deoxyinosine glycosylase [Paenibacillus terrigena]|uniref:DNA-deoxyinosine glycosylase n=1 Tax=Paenibacillus terrigena TaxID=369333 RepID=UPI0028D25A23|nr:DNA-deoxyinosine glycosylase [Paenibacillus terrigena]